MAAALQSATTTPRSGVATTTRCRRATRRSWPAPSRAAERTRAAGLRRLRDAAQFVKCDAGGEQRLAPLRVAGVDGRHISGLEGVRQDSHPHAERGPLAEQLDAACAGNEVRRDEVHLVSGPAEDR